MRGLKLNNTIIKKTVRNQTKNVTPYVGGEQVTPDAGFDGLGLVNIADIPTVTVQEPLNPNGYTMFIGVDRPKVWKPVLQNGSIVSANYIDHMDGDLGKLPSLGFDAFGDLSIHNTYSYFTQGTSTTKYWYLDPCIDFSLYLKAGYKYLIGDNVQIKLFGTTYNGIAFYLASYTSVGGVYIDSDISWDCRATKFNFFISNVNGSPTEQIVQPNTVYNANMPDPAKLHVRFTYYIGTAYGTPTSKANAGILTNIYVKDEV